MSLVLKMLQSLTMPVEKLARVLLYQLFLVLTMVSRAMKFSRSLCALYSSSRNCWTISILLKPQYLKDHVRVSFALEGFLLLPSALLCTAQVKEGVANPSLTAKIPVRLLMDKGFTAVSTYGFDWHWRAEAHQKHRKCPIKEYSTNLKSHHEVMTRTILNLLPLPLLIVTGSCLWNNYLSTLSTSARRIEVLIAQGVVATFVLDFRLRGLKRITCHTPHPESLFYPKTLQWEQDAIALALRTDYSLNLFLELAGYKSLTKTTTS